MPRALLTPMDASGFLADSYASALLRATVHGGRFSATEIFANEAQIGGAFVAQAAQQRPGLFAFHEKAGASLFLPNFPLHDYHFLKGKVRFADYAVLDAKSSRAARGKDTAEHVALAFMELKYHFVPGPFRGSSPYTDYLRLCTFRKFNGKRHKSAGGVLGVGFRWSAKSGDEAADRGAVGARQYDRQEKVFRKLERLLSNASRREWLTMIWLDYTGGDPKGVPQVQALGQHEELVERIRERERTRRITVMGPRGREAKRPSLVRPGRASGRI